MMLKFNRVCWLDLETTGVDLTKHDIIEIALLLELDGLEVARASWQCQPHPGKYLSRTAEQTTGLTREKILTFKSPREVYNELVALLDSHLVKYEKGCRFIIAGYNVAFDWEFLRQWFALEGGDDDRQFWFRFYAHTLCVRQTACEAGLAGKLPAVENLKLTTLTSALGIQHDEAHSALSDVLATRELYKRLKGDR